MLSLEQRLDQVEEMIRKPSFRQNKGLGNEVGYYIFDYPAEQELTVRERVEYIRQKNEEAISCCLETVHLLQALQALLSSM